MELIENVLQFLVTLLGFCLAVIYYRRRGRQAYFLLACFYGCFALGSLYWTLYLILFSKTPQVFYVSEFGWIASIIFLRILQYTLSDETERTFPCRTAWISVLLGAFLCVFYCFYGDILSNLLWCGMMMVISYCSVRGLIFTRKQVGMTRSRQYFHIGVLWYIAAEYALWTTGCFFSSNSIGNPYFWMDILLTGSLLGLFPATRKAVEA